MSILVDMHNQLVHVSGANEEETIQILKKAADDGITHMIATPSFSSGDYVTNGPAIEQSVKKLNAKLKRLAIPITVLAGMEIMLYEQLMKDITRTALPLANTNKYVRVVFQNNRIPPFALTVFLEMQLMGYIPIIANVERVQELTTNPKRLLEFIDRGALVHVSAASILGLNGRQTRKVALKLCKNGLVHLLSSASSDHEKRPSHIREAYTYLEKKLSPSIVKYFMENAECIVHGTDFHSRTGVNYKAR